MNPRAFRPTIVIPCLLFTACGGSDAASTSESDPDDSGGDRGAFDAGANAEGALDDIETTDDGEPSDDMSSETESDPVADVGPSGSSGGEGGVTSSPGPDDGASTSADSDSPREDTGAGGTTGATEDDPAVPVEPSPLDPAPDTTSEELETTEGCAGVFNPDQLLEFHLELPDADWNRVLADTTYATFVSAQFRCNDEAPIAVGVRRKRSGGQNKVGLKIDMNEFVPDQTWYGLKKLSLENGVSEGDDSDGAEVRAYISEYLAWRIMVLSAAVSSRAALANLRVNGELVGVYVNVEQVDKRFLQDRLGDDEGWLYKKSGGVGDGLKTHEVDGLENPYDDYFCFWANGNSCPLPSTETLASELPTHLDISQFLRFGAVNAFIGNTDGPLFKDNNYYYYDWVGGRSYLPWDLDTTMKDSPSVLSGGGAGGGGNGNTFVDVLFTNWRLDYESILLDLVQNRTPLDSIQAEIERAERVSADAFAQDPYVEGTASEAASSLAAYWIGRFADVETELGL